MTAAAIAVIFSVFPFVQDPGTGAEKTSTVQDKEKPDDQGGPKPLTDILSPWYALALGGFGALAYLIAVWTGFVGRDKETRDRLCQHLRNPAQQFFYVATGAGVAMVFQFPEAKFIPVQAFILGCTWPAVVSNYLSSRQSGEDPAKKEVANFRIQAEQVDKDRAASEQIEAKMQAAKDELASRLAEFELLSSEVKKVVPPKP